MTERSLPWDGVTTGDASEAPYSALEFGKILASISRAAELSNNGYVFHELLELEPTGVTSPIAVASGRAIIEGTYYENTADAVVVVPTPVTSTRIDRIVLRKTVADQTIRITRIEGTEGGSAPAMTQEAGVIWDIPICQASVATNGAVTTTDEREFYEDIS